MGKPKTKRALKDNEARAVLRTLRTSGQKLNLVAAMIRGKKVDKALAELEFSRKRISGAVKKTLESAVANAENNHGLDPDALVVAEAQDGGDVHWIVTGIAPSPGEVAEGAVPEGATQLTNSLGVEGWSAPCPPPGERYPLNFSLLALTQPTSVPAGTPASDTYRLLNEQANGKIAVLTATAIR